jgi:superfamily II DNA/RNA helicase
MGYTTPTPVQMAAIPAVFAKRNAMVLAETGSGKSLAFILPLSEMIKRGDGLKAIVMAPTRELAIQLYKEFLIFTQEHMSTAPRVKFLRKGLTPHTFADLQKLIGNTEILITTPLKLA